MTFDEVLSWVAIGLAASLAGMIWPFRRGTAGVIANMAVGVLGAIGAALASLLVTPSNGSTPARLFFAALGALAALGIAHAAWARHVQTMRKRAA